MTSATRYRLDDLRRLGSSLLVGYGVAPARASAFATQLLWFDAAGAARFGIETLPDWLDRIAGKSIDPASEGRVVRETIGTLVFDGAKGLPGLILARAAELATEKARDAGLGLIRVSGVGAAGPAAAVAAEIAVGPLATVIVGPGPSWCVALPSDEGLPAILDTNLGDPTLASEISNLALPWISALVPDGDWLVAALNLVTIEPLSGVLERVGAEMRRAADSPGRITPAAWEMRRREAREHGVAIAPEGWSRLVGEAEQLGVPVPAAAEIAPPSGLAL